MRLASTMIFILVQLTYLISCNSDSEENVPPECYIHGPLNNAVFTVNDDLMIRVEADDADGVIVNIEVQLNEETIATSNSSPLEYVYDLDGLAPGTYLLKARASDDRDQEASIAVQISIKAPLEVFTDARDGNVYRYVTIGGQTWMAENLAYLPAVSPSTEISGNTPLYYVLGYEGNDVSAAKEHSNYSLYGAHYNWEAASGSCPDGWRLPSENDWRELERFVDLEKGPFEIVSYMVWGSYYEGIGPHMRHTFGWGDVLGLNTYSFSALPGGGVPSISLTPENCYGCTNEGTSGWWSSTADGDGFLTRGMPDKFPLNFTKISEQREIGLSVRCLKNK